MVIDLDGVVKSRVINVYRSFAPQNGDSERRNFQNQLTLIESAVHVENVILLGDFNLNYAKKMISAINMITFLMILMKY